MQNESLLGSYQFSLEAAVSLLIEHYSPPANMSLVANGHPEETPFYESCPPEI